MSKSDYEERQLNLYKRRAVLAEAEASAIKQSRAYKIARTLGVIKTSLRSNPVGLAKKAAKVLLTEPAKLLSKSRNKRIIIDSIADQTSRYQEWILLNEPTAEELLVQQEQSDKLKYKPLISIITPVFNPPVAVFEELIESVLNQTYPNFELCLGNFGTNEDVRQLIKRFEAVDSRIKYWEFKDNDGIAENSNKILNKVQGEYIALLDHDDTLSPDALFENAKALNEAKYDFIYSDKDKIDEDGNRFDPLFKPEFSPETMLNVNYLTHFNVLKTSTVKEVGAWDSETDGAQDWDLFLKVTANNRTVHHIPKVLYHWRVISSSTAMSIETKPYALKGQRAAVDKHLRSIGAPGESYHVKTELFIKWDEAKLPKNPLVVVNTSGVMSNISQVVRKILIEAPEAVFLINTHDNGNYIKTTYSPPESILGLVTENNLLEEVAKVAKRGTRPVIFIDDSLKLDKGWYEHLVGWLLLPDVGAVGSRIIDRSDLIIDGGGVDSYGSYQELFTGYPLCYQSYIGNSEWVRNVSMLSGVMFATQIDLIARFLKRKPNRQTVHSYLHWLRSENERLVFNPHCTATGDVHHLKTRLTEVESFSQKSMPDIYSSPNVSKSNPMNLFDEEDVVSESIALTDMTSYQKDALILANSYDISQQELDRNNKTLHTKNNSEPNTAAFILPSFDAIYAGLMNIFSFAKFLQDDKKLKLTFYILKNSQDLSVERKMVGEKMPSLAKASFVSITESQIDKISSSDLGISTLWSTAYVLAKTNKISRKCYFIQDNETNFYPKGTVSALVEMSYRFGFYAIANTEGLLKFYQDEFGGDGTVLQSKVDLSNYHPRENLYETPKKPYKVFFYARPNMPRNAFELGIAGLKKLKEEMGNDVEVITAGAAWDVEAYGVKGYFTNLGKIKYETVPILYRTLDAGLMFMFSGHPGVTASELMASGCPVVVNEYNDVTWNDLYQHEKTCLITKPTASEVAANIKRCLVDQELRKTLIKNGLDKTRSFYGDYEDQLPQAYDAIVEHFSK